MYHKFFSSNGFVALPFANAEIWFTTPLTFIPNNYRFDTYALMTAYFTSNPTLLIQNQIFRVVSTGSFYKYDGNNIQNITNDFMNQKVNLQYSDIFASTVPLQLYYNDNRSNYVTVGASSDQGIDGLEINHIYLANNATDEVSIVGLYE
jgi:hypothetical protein